MKGIIDNITDWLILFTERLKRGAHTFDKFLNKGRNRFILISIVVLFMGLQFSKIVYVLFENPWAASVPVVLSGLALFFVDIIDSYKDKMKTRNRVSRMRLVGLNLDFNQPILGRIYRQLTKYGYLDEDLTSFPDFYNVLVLDFDEHDYNLYNICTTNCLLKINHM